MDEPLAPPWPTPIMDLEEYTAFKAKWRAELQKLRDSAEHRLAVMTDSVRAQRPELCINTTLFDMGSQVGIAAGIQGGKRFAVRTPVAGFDADKLREIVNALGAKSAMELA